MNIVKLQDIKSTHRNPLHSYTLAMRKQNKKSRKQIPFTITMKRLKDFGIYLTKKTKDLYIENYKTPRGKHRQNTLRNKPQQDPL